MCKDKLKKRKANESIQSCKWTRKDAQIGQQRLSTKAASINANLSAFLMKESNIKRESGLITKL